MEKNSKLFSRETDKKENLERTERQKKFARQGWGIFETVLTAEPRKIHRRLFRMPDTLVEDASRQIWSSKTMIKKCR
jgi:hypothetical protein